MDDARNMNTKTLTVLAQVKAKPGKEAEVRKALLSLVAPSRKDAGCVNYDLHQATDNPAMFLFHENWTSKEALDAHLKSSHVAALLPRVDELCMAFPEIKIWEQIGRLI